MVVAGIDCVAGEHPDLGRLRLPLVENFEIVVSRSSIQKDLRQTVSEEPRGEDLDDLENQIVGGLSALTTPTTEAIRKVRQGFSRRLEGAPPRSVVALALQLVRHAAVPRFVAYELILYHRPALRSLKAKSLEELGAGNNSWGEVDTFACYLAGPVWREGQVSDALIRRWASSSDRWWRRTAAASTIALNNKARGGKGDTVRTLMVCKMLVADRDDMVVKALSWALRELSKRDPESVRSFLRKYKNVLAARVVREVDNKLKTGLKNPRKQTT
jgi:3-methyladenine DNA glycosylase AlkD